MSPVLKPTPRLHIVRPVLWGLGLIFLGVVVLSPLHQAQAQTPATADNSAESAAQGLAGELKNLTRVEFRQFTEASRVVLKTTDPVTYRIIPTAAGIDVILDNTRVPIFNNTRPLNTQYFDSPVRWVQAHVIEGASPSVRIEIRLRKQVAVQDSQNDDGLVLDFPR